MRQAPWLDYTSYPALLITGIDADDENALPPHPISAPAPPVMCEQTSMTCSGNTSSSTFALSVPAPSHTQRCEQQCQCQRPVHHPILISNVSDGGVYSATNSATNGIDSSRPATPLQVIQLAVSITPHVLTPPAALVGKPM